LTKFGSRGASCEHGRKALQRVVDNMRDSDKRVSQRDMVLRDLNRIQRRCPTR
jgi:hypothetical protein